MFAEGHFPVPFWLIVSWEEDRFRVKAPAPGWFMAHLSVNFPSVLMNWADMLVGVTMNWVYPNVSLFVWAKYG